MVSIHNFHTAGAAASLNGVDPTVLERQTGEAAALFAAIDRLGGGHIARVLLSDQWNAGCVIARRGLARDLRIGLPLFECLSVRELEAILAHELAHARSLQSRVWRALARLLHALRAVERRADGRADSERETRIGRIWRQGARAVRVAVERRWLMLSRRCEFSADAAAAQGVGRQVLAAALIRVALAEQAFVQRQGGDAARPELDPVAQLARLLAQSPRAFDTHPTLAERLAALRVESRVPEVLGEAAAVLLGGSLRPALAHVASLRPNRTAAGSAAAEPCDIARRDGLSLPDDIHTDDIEAALTAAKAIWQRRGAAPAVEHLQRVTALHPTSARAQFLLGRALIESGCEHGLIAIERAFALDATAVTAGAELLSFAAREADDHARADRYAQISADGLDEFLAACQSERQLSPGVPLLHHRLDDACIARISAACAEAAWIKAFHAVRRPVREWLCQPGLHIIIVPRAEAPTGAATQALRDRLEAALGNALFVLTIVSADDTWLLPRLNGRMT